MHEIVSNILLGLTVLSATAAVGFSFYMIYYVVQLVRTTFKKD